MIIALGKRVVEIFKTGELMKPLSEVLHVHFIFSCSYSFHQSRVRSLPVCNHQLLSQPF